MYSGAKKQCLIRGTTRFELYACRQPVQAVLLEMPGHITPLFMLNAHNVPAYFTLSTVLHSPFHNPAVLCISASAGLLQSVPFIPSSKQRSQPAALYFCRLLEIRVSFFAFGYLFDGTYLNIMGFHMQAEMSEGICIPYFLNSVHGFA